MVWPIVGRLVAKTALDIAATVALRKTANLMGEEKTVMWVKHLGTWTLKMAKQAVDSDVGKAIAVIAIERGAEYLRKRFGPEAGASAQP